MITPNKPPRGTVSRGSSIRAELSGPPPEQRGYWYQHAFFYGLDLRRFQDSDGNGMGDIQGCIRRLDYLQELGVDTIWLLPFYDSPLRDNGYDVRDYYRIDPRVGSMADFMELVGAVHQRGMHIIVDLVMNHSSNEHPWFEAARRDPQSRYYNYYIWSEERPEHTEQQPIFPGEEDDVWTRDDVAGAYYFHRFYHFQPDLRTSNPAVQEEIMRAMDFWLALGVDGFRIDAAPLMLEEKGLSSTRMDDPHKLFRDLHDYAVARRPDVVLLGEANLSMEQMDEFFGGGSEMNMLFNFQLGPHILLSLEHNNARPISEYLQALLDPPANDQWLNFLRNHDELSLEVMPPPQKEAIFQAFAPDKNMRIYERGIRRRLAPMLADFGKDREPEAARARLELAFSLLFSTPGTPVVMWGDELGMGDDLSQPGREPARAAMQWNDSKNGGFSKADETYAPVIREGAFAYAKVNAAAQQADPQSLYHFIRQIAALRRSHPNIGLVHNQVIEPKPEDERILIHCYPPLPEGQAEPLYLFHNLSDAPDTVTLRLPESAEAIFGPGALRAAGAAEAGQNTQTQEEGRMWTVELPPYGYLWVRAGEG